MNFWIESLWYALKSLYRHRLRTFLTMLGVIFGVAAVIGMLSIGKGAEQEAVEQIASFGINTVRVYARELNESQQLQAQRTPSVGLSYADAQYIGQVLPYVVAVAPQNLLDKPVYYRQSAPEAQVVGTTPAYLGINVLQLEQGRFLSQDDLALYRKVCVLSQALARQLFLKEDPLGQLITVGGERFEVVGVLAGRTQTKQRVQIRSRDISRDLYLPITTSLAKFSLTSKEQTPHNQVDYNVVDELSLQVSGPEYLAAAKSALTSILTRRHYGVPATEIVVPTELLEQSQQTQRLFNLVMACIAGLSLLVGGIGIMNIMLASVTERTRQIGIRRAIGATPGDILILFLLESLLICLIGGLIGIAVGVGISQIVTVAAGWKTIVSPESILLSFGVSSVVGIFFGLYPAWRASQLDPIQALRHE
ncbi:MAG: ABC transporter permease [Candidatus Melainabacteria bacterium HGW-Melainabacteria-1]|nr:MAG: ABC transporter permease [Candidatus Melainabacteria bacterium HGW-Melainabacteria-1]